MYGSTSVPVISPTALTCPMFSAISAITAGSTSSTAETRKSGAWKSGRPIHGASATADRSTRGWVSTWPVPAL